MNIQTISSTKYLEKIEELEKEFLKFKKSPNFGFPKKLLSLKGILKKIKINEKEIIKSRKGLFKNLNS